MGQVDLSLPSADVVAHVAQYSLSFNVQMPRAKFMICVSVLSVMGCVMDNLTMCKLHSCVNF